MDGEDIIFKDLTPTQLKIFEIEFLRRKKDTLLAYLFWFFLFPLGVHKFYLQKIYEGILYIISGPIASIFFISYINTNNPTFLLLSFIFLALLTGMWMYDLFTLWKQVEKTNKLIQKDILEKIKI